MRCTACSHYLMCIFRLKAQNVVNNHSHMFTKGSYTLLSKMAAVCKHYEPKPGFSSGVLPNSLAECEEQCIVNALSRCDNSRSAAANLLGIGERTLYRKLSQYREIAGKS